MKKFALCVALAVMATGAMAKEWKTVRIGVDASYPPFESKAPNGDIVVQVAPKVTTEGGNTRQ
ncbi:ABC-type amino acid transport substrate-binding protein [Paraburkholderia youngii]